ncbi:Mannosyltransferase [Caenorhabditis elegans]|uniref:Mannosyltransferase n=1 Tax=Caenorhabditis elegans TaxID=6239 RepID=G5EDN2_CAEEL|nr:Mannosyltransferase [Caenorhabditis elegans]CAD24083.1 putative alpha 2 mannosyltransferase [Caenorhabditis elegans]CCD72091.1 Mannosyltransferase [Caenorhabditis elegans]|eukprot:NP_001254097.1 Mannosyltransferase [Caenorhabditis elegans]
MRTTLRLLAKLVVFRCISVYLVASWFVPDEVYQSAEVAHHLVYGTGHLSWEWRHSLRSFFHPALIAVIIKFLDILSLSSQPLIYHIPRLAHALLFALADFSFYKICLRLCKTKGIAENSFVTYLSSWFVFYCAPRTLSNSLETSLTLIALNWFPFETKNFKGPTWPYIALGVLTIIIRPTVALIWLVFGVYHLYHSPTPVRLIFQLVLPVTLPILIVTTLIDSWAYGTPTIPLWNFLQFNVVQGGSALFGVHPWYWYIVSGIPAVLTVQMIPIIVGLLGPNIFRPSLLPFFATITYIIVHSLLPHKEQRFLLPIIPLLCIYAGGAFQNLKKWRGSAMAVMIAINIGIALFTSRYHQVGPFTAPRRIMEEWRGHHGKLSVAALMPCYSIPGHAFWHDHLDNLRLLDCSPDLEQLRGPTELDESDQFHGNATKWLIETFSLEHHKYQRVLMYEKYYETSRRWFESNGWYQCIEKIWHSIALTSSREDNYMIVLCRNGY